MIRGGFDQRGSPRILGLVVANGLPDSIPAEVTFLLDTGSDSTCLHPRDAYRLGVSLSSLKPTVVQNGIGGTAEYDRIQTCLYFLETRWLWKPSRMLGYDVCLHVALPTEANRNIPSLLGKDILHRWNILYAPRSGKLECQPSSIFDHEIILPRGY